MTQKFLHFIRKDIWRVRANELPRFKRFLIRSLRVMIVSVREFIDDQCMLRASALTFYSLLSIVPVFAMAFGVAKGFGMDRILKERLMENAGSQQEVFTRIIEFSENLLQNTRGGIIAGIGLIFLFWTVIKVLGNIEVSFNKIWGVKKERELGRKFADYLSLMLILPTFFLVASSATVFIASQIRTITESVSILGMFGPVIYWMLKLLPLTIFWGLLTYLYMFMPNTRINFKSAFMAGIVAGTVYQIVQWAYIYFQVGVSKAGAVYGSFAALPLFLMWLQISWLIVLYGAELSFAHQNDETFEFEQDCLTISERLKKIIAIQITALCIRQFRASEKPLTASKIARELDLPIRLTRDLLFRLTEAGVLARVVSEDERDPAFHPARPLEELTMKCVMDRLDTSGLNEIPFGKNEELQKLSLSLQESDETLKALKSNKVLVEL